MIKKFTLIILLAISLVITGTNVKNNDVYAYDELGYLSLEVIDFGSGPEDFYYGLSASYTYSPATTSIELFVPQTDYNVLSTSICDSRVYFLNEFDFIEYTYIMDEEFFGKFDGYFDFDLEAMGILNTVKVQFIICQSYSVIPDYYIATIQEFFDYYVRVYYETPLYREEYFLYYDIPEADEKVSSDLREFTIDATALTIDLSDYKNWKCSNSDESQQSSISFYNWDPVNEEHSFYTTINLCDDFFDGERDLFILNFAEDWIDYETVGPFTLYAMSIVLDELTQDQIFSLNESIHVYHEVIGITYIDYYSLDRLIGSDFVRRGEFAILPSIVEVPEGSEFYGWFYESGIPFNPNAIPSEYLIGETINIYAYFTDTTNDLDIDTTETPVNAGENIEGFYIGFGLDNDFGRVAVYFIFIIITSIVLHLMTLPLTIIGVIDLLLTFLFMYLGLLPIIVSTLSVLSIIVVILISSGGKSNE